MGWLAKKLHFDCIFHNMKESDHWNGVENFFFGGLVAFLLAGIYILFVVGLAVPLLFKVRDPLTDLEIASTIKALVLRMPLTAIMLVLIFSTIPAAIFIQYAFVCIVIGLCSVIAMIFDPAMYKIVVPNVSERGTVTVPRSASGNKDYESASQ